MGNKKNEGKNWQSGLAERFVPPLDNKWAEVGPRHPKWKERVKQELMALAKYVEFLSSEYPRPWLRLKPDRDPRYNYMIWRGFIQVPSRPEVKFDMLILLSSEYPVVIPRCFLEESVEKYSGKLYIKNRYQDKASGKTYIMICHDHMGEVKNAWEPNLGIAHFFIREVWFWFAAMQNHILTEWDKQHS